VNQLFLSHFFPPVIWVKHLSSLTICLFQVNAAAEIIYDLVDPNANLIFGAVIDPSLSGQVSCNPLYLE
jgi:hypothetical protein